MKGVVWPSRAVPAAASWWDKLSMKPREQAQVGEERARIHHDLGAGSLFGGSREFKFYFWAPSTPTLIYIPTFHK